MLDLELRTAIFALSRQGRGVKKIARMLKVSRNTVRQVLRSGQVEVPRVQRPEQAGPHLARLRELHAECAGNRVRLHQELAAEGITLPYATLTATLRRHGIGVEAKTPAGEYHFAAGQEMQSDTSPHDVMVAERRRRLQCAGLWLGYSRMRYLQYYPTYNRFYCKVFHVGAARYLEGMCRRNTVDNTSVVIASGTGAKAVVAPEIAAFAKRLGFVFVAHEKGDTNRSAGVERGFHTVERNFLVRRSFASLEDLNRQLFEWCHAWNSAYRRDLKASPLELWRQERPYLQPLPEWLPEVYQLHHRTVDLCGMVRVHTNRYSAPAELIGRDVEVHETHQRVRIFHRRQLVADHPRHEEGAREKSVLPEHARRGRYRHRKPNPPPTPEEGALRAGPAELGRLLDLIRERYGGRAVRPIRALHRLYLDYPEAALLAAVHDALHYGLCDMTRLETMVLRRVAGDFFRLPTGDHDHDDREPEEPPDE